MGGSEGVGEHGEGHQGREEHHLCKGGAGVSCSVKEYVCDEQKYGGAKGTHGLQREVLQNSLLLQITLYAYNSHFKRYKRYRYNLLRMVTYGWS